MDFFCVAMQVAMVLVLIAALVLGLIKDWKRGARMSLWRTHDEVRRRMRVQNREVI